MVKEVAKLTWINCVIAGVCVGVITIVAWFCLVPMEKIPVLVKAEKFQNGYPESQSCPNANVLGVSVTNVVPRQFKFTICGQTEDEKLLAGRDTNEWIVVTNPYTGQKYVSKLMRPGLKNQSPPYFKNHALNVLDALQYAEMSDPLIGVEIDDRFMQSFNEALVNPIEIDPEDDEDRIAHRKTMQETLMQLKKSLKDGADLKAIVQGALKERRRISALKDMMREERKRMRDEGVSEEEVVAFERACNKKLEGLGAKPMLTRELIIKKTRERKSLE